MKQNKLALLLCACCGIALAEPLNIADSAIHPYANPAAGREGKALANERVNEARLYDFYARQADFYMAQPEVPSLLPAFPGLDAGLHGHWGKHNQNGHQEPAVGRQIFGRLLYQMVAEKRLGIKHGAFVSLGAAGSLSSCFDPARLTYGGAWSGGLAKVHPFRWGASRGATPGGELLWTNDRSNLSGRFNGFYRHGPHTIFDYSLGDTRVLDLPSAIDEPAIFTRTMEFSGAARALSLELIAFPKGTEFSSLPRLQTPHVIARAGKLQWLIVADAVGAQVAFQKGRISATVRDGSRIRLAIYKGRDLAVAQKALEATPLQKPSSLISGGPAQWATGTITTSGSLGEAEGALAIDTIALPFDNPERSLVMLTGIAFLPDGDAVVCCLNGDLWRVSGLDDKLQSVSWRRVARGLNQPFGMCISRGVLHVMARTEVLALHDLNKDGEYDRFEVVADDFNARSAGIAMHFGLASDSRGDLIFINESNLSRWSPETGKTSRIAQGFRNGMGLAVLPDDRIWVAPQEGNWTPAGYIADVRSGEDYGFPGFRGSRDSKSPPMHVPFCFLPRGIDCSIGGLVPIDSNAWGPLSGKVIGLSYGYGTQYLILDDDSGKQGAIVPLPGAFRSGAVRGEIRPQDQHMYVVGCEGWGNYAVDDGCLHRVRYLKQAAHFPIGFAVLESGIRVDFEEPLAADSATVFAQAWNVEYASRYGSPEFSLRNPSKLGHDRLKVGATRLTKGGKSLEIALPDMRPACQVYLRMHLKTASGSAFKTDLFATVRELGAESLKPMIRAAAVSKKPKRGKKADRTVVLKAIPGLRYDQIELTATPGERLKVRLKNEDPAMPHNWVLVEPDAVVKVGEASFKMLSDPAAEEKSYVPDLSEVIAFVPIVQPNAEESVVFKVPKKPGSYPFICTFPGHWQAMRGVLVVAQP